MRHLVFAALLGATALPVSAEDAWDSIALQLYGDRALLDGGDVIAIDAPYRTQNDSRTQIAAMVRAPEGLNIGTVTLVLTRTPCRSRRCLRWRPPCPPSSST